MTEKEPECTTCKNPFNGIQKGILVLSVYILISSIYGTVKLVEEISSLF
jgi:hypothetical protein